MLGAGGLATTSLGGARRRCSLFKEAMRCCIVGMSTCLIVISPVYGFGGLRSRRVRSNSLTKLEIGEAVYNWGVTSVGKTCEHVGSSMP